MNSLLLLVLVAAGYAIVYFTYGRYIYKRVFGVNSDNVCPSVHMRDDIDYVPTHKSVLFGHHFTSIAGVGPIVGPALAVIWGWGPALLWVFFGSIFIGAVHDFGALVVSLRNKGRSIGEMAGEIVNPRVRTLFLLIIFFLLWIVISIFTLIIAKLFIDYPAAVIPIWVEVPVAMALGYLVYKKGMNHHVLSIIAVIVLYVTVVAGAYYPVSLPALGAIKPIWIWMGILFAYAYIASTLPVQTLLQPRDYINSHQLMVAMALLIGGVAMARPAMVAPVYNPAPEGAPTMWPFLFVIIACGAVSGFHCLVSSGTSSKQCAKEPDAYFIGFGGMLMEGLLAALVILAVGAGLGIGLESSDGQMLSGVEAFNHQYSSWATAQGLSAKLNAFITGSANMIASLGIPKEVSFAVMGVFIVSFAATTLDSATRIQRYVVAELALCANLKPLASRHPATMFAILSAVALAFYDGSGTGAMKLWPLFGCVNQLLGGLALLVLTLYLARKRANFWVAAAPMLFMIGMTGWALTLTLSTQYKNANWPLLAIGLAVFALEIWMIIEAGVVLKGVLAAEKTTDDESGMTADASCGE